MSLADDAASGFTGMSDSDLDMSIPLSYVQPDMLAYIAGPYTAKTPSGDEDHEVVAERMRIFCLVVGKLVDLGIKPCSPLYMHLIRQFNKGMPGDWNFWGSYSGVMLKKCDVMIVVKIDGWEQSTGVQGEIDIAIEQGIPIIFVDPADLVSKEKLESKDDGTILITVSKIQNPTARRLAIVGSVVPIVAINTLLIGVAIVRMFLRSTVGIFTSARKVW